MSYSCQSSSRSSANGLHTTHYRPDSGFQTVISPSSLLSRPDIIPFAQVHDPPLTTLVSTPLMESELEHLRQDISRRAQTTETLQEELARANDLNDKYYDRIAVLEERLQASRQVEEQRDAFAVELRAAQSALAAEREFKQGNELMTQVRVDLDSRERQDYEFRIESLTLELQEQRREIQRLLDLGDAYCKRQDYLEAELASAGDRLKREQGEKVRLEALCKEWESHRSRTQVQNDDASNRLAELQSNLEEISHHNSQLAKMLKEQQDLNQLLSLKLREAEEIRSENNFLQQKLRTFQSNLAEVESKYEKQLTENYQMQVKIRAEKETKRSVRRTTLCHSVDYGDVKFSHPNTRLCKVQSTRASLTPKNLQAEESESSYDELDEMVRVRKAELGIQPPEVVVRYKKPPAKRGNTSFGRGAKRSVL